MQVFLLCLTDSSFLQPALNYLERCIVYASVLHAHICLWRKCLTGHTQFRSCQRNSGGKERKCLRRRIDTLWAVLWVLGQCTILQRCLLQFNSSVHQKYPWHGIAILINSLSIQLCYQSYLDFKNSSTYVLLINIYIYIFKKKDRLYNTLHSCFFTPVHPHAAFPASRITLTIKQP